MKHLSNTEAELKKKSLLIKKACNRKRTTETTIVSKNTESIVTEQNITSLSKENGVN